MKLLKNLTLLDRFLFAETMEDVEAYQALLRIILGDEALNLLTPAQTEKEFRTAPWLKSIRVDVYVMDENGTVYNTEVQQRKRDDLVRRTRYYQALIDSSLLAPGEVNYNSIKDTTIIMIMPFDLFGKDRFIYTFEEVCKEDPSLNLQDGAKRIFINTKGKNYQDVSSEFIALMKYFEYNEDTEEPTDADSSNSNLLVIKNRVAAVKASEEVGIRYMNKWEDEDLIRHEAKEEGLAEGRAEGLAEGHAEGLNEGRAEGVDLTSTTVTRLISGESSEDILASGVPIDVLEAAEKLIATVKNS